MTTTPQGRRVPGPGGARHRLVGNRVLQVAVGMVLAQLAFRAWVVYSSWFTGDDYMFISRMINGGTAVDRVVQPHGGHVMPAGLYLSWLSNVIGPYDYTINATMLLVMQAVANVGLVFLLVRLFGLRAGILPPLAPVSYTHLTLPTNREV